MARVRLRGVRRSRPAPIAAAVLGLLAQNRGPDSYLAGGAALHFAPNSHRFSNDLDFFHDSEERVATAFAADAEVLRRAGLALEVELSQPGHIRALVSQGSDSTRIDWAHDSSWRFMPPVRVEGGGYLLHDIDLVVPEADVDLAEQGITLHFGSPGGVLPLPSGTPIAPRES